MNIPTDFSQLIGNEPVKRYLKKMIDNRAIANSLLFAGPEGIGKSLFAQVLAASLICENDSEGTHRFKIEKANHPDIHHYRPEGKSGMHSIHSMRLLKEEVFLPPHESNWKVFIVHEADRMLSYSANALLKTFEEPPSNTVILLVSSSPASILPTIISRCRSVYFHTLTTEEVKQFLKQSFQLDETALHRIAQQSRGSLSRAIQLVKQGEHPNRNYILDVLTRVPFSTYKEVIQVAEYFTEQFESNKKETENLIREELHHIQKEHLTAHQQQAVEKELEGAVALKQASELHAIFDVILSWYRDGHLLLVGGKEEYLFNLDYEEQLAQSVQRGNYLSLEYVQNAIKEACSSLQSAISVQVCLENLFLKLNFVA